MIVCSIHPDIAKYMGTDDISLDSLKYFTDLIFREREEDKDDEELMDWYDLYSSIVIHYYAGYDRKRSLFYLEEHDDKYRIGTIYPITVDAYTDSLVFERSVFNEAAAASMKVNFPYINYWPNEYICTTAMSSEDEQHNRIYYFAHLSLDHDCFYDLLTEAVDKEGKHTTFLVTLEELKDNYDKLDNISKYILTNVIPEML